MRNKKTGAMGIVMRRTGTDIKRSAIVESDKKNKPDCSFCGRPRPPRPTGVPVANKIRLIEFKSPGDTE